MWLWLWYFLGWKSSKKLSWLLFYQRSFVYCDVKGLLSLLSSVPCQVEIRLECIILPAVTLQAAADVIPCAYTVLAAGLALQHMEAPNPSCPGSLWHTRCWLWQSLERECTESVPELLNISFFFYFSFFFMVLFPQDLKLPLILLHLIILSMNKNPFRVRKVLYQSP